MKKRKIVIPWEVKKKRKQKVRDRGWADWCPLPSFRSSSIVVCPALRCSPTYLHGLPLKAMYTLSLPLSSNPSKKPCPIRQMSKNFRRSYPSRTCAQPKQLVSHPNSHKFIVHYRGPGALGMLPPRPGSWKSGFELRSRSEASAGPGAGRLTGLLGTTLPPPAPP